MGIDAAIFATKANRFAYFDRLYNLVTYDLDASDTVGELVRRVQEHEVLSREDIERLLDAPNAQARPWWQDTIRGFVASFPDDEYRVYSDGSEPLWWAVRDASQAKEWHDE